MTVCAASSSASAVAPSSSSSALEAMPTSSEMVIFLDWIARMPGAGLVLSYESDANSFSAEPAIRNNSREDEQCVSSRSLHG